MLTHLSINKYICLKLEKLGLEKNIYCEMKVVVAMPWNFFLFLVTTREHALGLRNWSRQPIFSDSRV